MFFSLGPGRASRGNVEIPADRWLASQGRTAEDGASAWYRSEARSAVPGQRRTPQPADRQSARASVRPDRDRAARTAAGQEDRFRPVRGAPRQRASHDRQRVRRRSADGDACRARPAMRSRARAARNIRHWEKPARGAGQLESAIWHPAAQTIAPRRDHPSRDQKPVIRRAMRPEGRPRRPGDRRWRPSRPASRATTFPPSRARLRARARRWARSGPRPRLCRLSRRSA